MGATTVRFSAQLSSLHGESVLLPKCKCTHLNYCILTLLQSFMPTGSCGGNRSICTTYASALTYADDLGLRAMHGFSQYQRQAFFGGEYGLTDTKAKHPQSALGADEPVILRPGYCACLTASFACCRNSSLLISPRHRPNEAGWLSTQRRCSILCRGEFSLEACTWTAGAEHQ